MEKDRNSLLDIHAVIISWPGQEPNARHIEQQLQSFVRKVTVIHSLTGESSYERPPHWVVMPDGAFYGSKVGRSLELHDHGVMIHIHADTSYRDWVSLVQRCLWVHGRLDSVGIWTPHIDFSPLELRRARIRKTSVPKVTEVMVTDGIIWSMAPELVEQLKKLDYSVNALGWGIEVSAAAICKVNQLAVVHDASMRVLHPAGTSYSAVEARAQQQSFFAQLSDAEYSVVQEIHRKYDGHGRRQGNSLLRKIHLSVRRFRTTNFLRRPLP